MGDREHIAALAVRRGLVKQTDYLECKRLAKPQRDIVVLLVERGYLTREQIIELARLSRIGRDEPKRTPSKIQPVVEASRPFSFRKLWIFGGAGVGALGVVITLILFLSREPESPRIHLAAERPPEASSKTPAEAPQAKSQDILAQAAALPDDQAYKLLAEYLKENRGSVRAMQVRARMQKIEDRLGEKASAEFDRIKKEADHLEEAKKLDEALKVWKTFPANLDPSGSYTGHVQAEVERLVESKSLYDDMSRAEVLIKDAKYDAAIEMLDKYSEAPVLEVRNRAVHLLDETRIKRCLAMLAPTLEARRKGAPQKLDQARQEIACAAAAKQARAAQLEARLKGKNISVQLRYGDSQRKGKVVAYAGDTISFDIGTYPVDALHPRTQLEVFQAACDPDDARAFYDIGRCYIRLRDFKNAEASFKKALDLDIKLEPIIPDLAAIQKQAVSIRGEYQITGNSIGIDYTFQDETVKDDFEGAVKNARVSGGILTVSGEETFAVTRKEIPFEGDLSARVELTEAKSSLHMLAFQYVDASNDTIALLFVASIAKGQVGVIRRTKSGADTSREEDLLSATPIDKASLLEITVRAGQVVFLANNRKVFATTVGVFSRPQISLGGRAARGGGVGTVGFTRFMVRGMVQPEWLAKLRAESLVVLERELNRESTILFEEKADLSGREIQETTLHPLIEGLPSDLAGALMNSERRINSLLKAPSPGDYEQCLVQLKEVERRIAGFPLVAYLKGMLALSIGQETEAKEFFGKAIEAEPRFPEPYVQRARLFIRNGRYEEAARDLTRAEELMPDLADVYSVRSSLRLRELKRKEAFEDVQVARRLRPWDVELSKLEKKIGNVLRGPLWPKVYTRETAHYVVKTDISQDRCDLYAENVEIVHRYYEERFNFKGDPKIKDELLVFNTAEGYHTYADLTHESRNEQSLGYFEPVYRQFLFYELADLRETLRTMYHEQFHHFIDQVIPSVPSWANEGLAEYFAGLSVDRAHQKIAGVPQVIEWRLTAVHELIRGAQRGIPWRDLMLAQRGDFYGGLQTFCYAQAWSMMYFFFQHDGGKYAGVMNRYLAALRRGASAADAFNETFQKEKLAQMEGEWLDYVKRLKP